jgi:hypothetical protein
MAEDAYFVAIDHQRSRCRRIVAHVARTFGLRSRVKGLARRARTADPGAGRERERRRALL